MRNRLFAAALLVAGIGLAGFAGCAHNTTTPNSAQAEVDQLETQGNKVKGEFMKAHPDADAYYEGSAGYAVFPKVHKGAFIIGGGYGKGLVYENGTPDMLVGRCSVTQGSIGLSIGGQKFSEIIFFQDKDALQRFKDNKLEINATASAVAGDSGATGKARYSDGVAVFVLGESGLMVEAAIGGQKFKYTAM
jgi:lipid-binding SYLF domain-containing protein